MYHFVNDYSEGAHPLVLQALAEQNLDPQPGYGEDAYCARAAKKILQACGCPDGQVTFLVGGTQTNATVIDGLLASYQGVIACDTGHVSTHESGAVEAFGHKVLTLPHENGKLASAALQDYLENFFADPVYEHMVIPGMVYISQPTEYGTLYTKKELAALADVCHRYELKLFADGARLGYALTCPENDVTLADLAALCDVFYIGGTKVGALCGEAVVFPRGDRPRHFTAVVKRHGALLAKGRVLGVQFDALFTNDLYCTISRNAIATAALLKEGFRRKNIPFYVDSPTNQIFVILQPAQYDRLCREAAFSFWTRLSDGRIVARFVTSWATREADVRALIALL